MEFQICLRLLRLVILMGFLCSSSKAYKFFVGGKDGWVVNPAENYSHWAERNRFQVNDTLYFKYNIGCDSVLVVKREDYYNCTTQNPIQTLKDGESEFKFNHSGPFFFISGNDDSCQKGQKLIVVVMAIRNKQPPHHLAPSPATLPPPLQSPPPDLLSPGYPVDLNAPAPAPSGSPRFGGSVVLVWGLSIGVSAFLGCFNW